MWGFRNKTFPGFVPASWKRGKLNITCLVQCCIVSPQKSSHWLCDKCSKKWCRIWGHFSWMCFQRSCNYNFPLKLLTESSSLQLLAWQPAQCSVSSSSSSSHPGSQKCSISGSSSALWGCALGLPPWDLYLQVSLCCHDLWLKVRLHQASRFVISLPLVPLKDSVTWISPLCLLLQLQKLNLAQYQSQVFNMSKVNIANMCISGKFIYNKIL